MHCAYVYILTNRTFGTLYIGMTTDLARRIDAHRVGAVPGFTKQHHLHRLVWYEAHESIHAARTREMQIKGWRRDWKVNLIQSINPAWNDLASMLG